MQGIYIVFAKPTGHKNPRRGGDFLARCDIAARKSCKFKDFLRFCEAHRPLKKSSKSQTNEKMIKTQEKSFVKFPNFSFFTQGKVEKIPVHFSVKKKNTFWRINFLIEKNVEFSVAKISYLAGHRPWSSDACLRLSGKARAAILCQIAMRRYSFVSLFKLRFTKQNNFAPRSGQLATSGLI